MQRVSGIFRDQMTAPVEKAVYWIEYVLRHGRAEHLLLASRNQSAYQRSLVDVYFVLALFALVLSLVLFRSLRFGFERLRAIVAPILLAADSMPTLLYKQPALKL